MKLKIKKKKKEPPFTCGDGDETSIYYEVVLSC